MKKVAVLFARPDSIYKKILGCDVYDKERDARNFLGGLPVIAHPPCRAWGNYAYKAKPEPGEKELAFFAVDAVRRCGGVLEHPATSKLWKAAGLPMPGRRDEYGGFTISVDQGWFGHRAIKKTFLYICGILPGDLPEFTMKFRLDHVPVEKMGLAEREATPAGFASWLFSLASQCHFPETQKSQTA